MAFVPVMAVAPRGPARPHENGERASEQRARSNNLKVHHGGRHGASPGGGRRLPVPALGRLMGLAFWLAATASVVPGSTAASEPIQLPAFTPHPPPAAKSPVCSRRQHIMGGLQAGPHRVVPFHFALEPTPAQMCSDRRKAAQPT